MAISANNVLWSTIIHRFPTCEVDSPPPKTPKVSSNHVIRLDLHCFHDSCPETKESPWFRSLVTLSSSKDLRTKKTSYLPQTPTLNDETGERTKKDTLAQMKRIEDSQ